MGYIGEESWLHVHGGWVHEKRESMVVANVTGATANVKWKTTAKDGRERRGEERGGEERGKEGRCKGEGR